jgi:hypothetical protein
MSLPKSYRKADVSPWTEALAPVELLLLHAAPVFYGFGIPRGDNSCVVVIPGLLVTDVSLAELHAWLKRIGYRPYFSGVGFDAECPNLLIQRRLNDTIDRARRQTRRKVHVIGHSLGGIIARSVAHQRPDDIASVITLASPFRGTVAHSSILRVVEAVRQRILNEHGPAVLPECYTARCTCDFLDCLRRDTPDSVLQTAIYTRDDGLVDWRYCVTQTPGADFEVSGTHVGLVFNPSVYTVIAARLAAARPRTRSLPTNAD